MTSLKVNGVERQFAPDEMPRTLSQLLEDLGVEAATVVAEIDGVIVRPADFSQTKLHNGQCIELVKFMGGG